MQPVLRPGVGARGVCGTLPLPRMIWGVGEYPSYFFNKKSRVVNWHGSGIHHLEPQTTSLKLMFGETTISYVKICNHPIETTIYKWLFGVPGSSILDVVCQLEPLHSISSEVIISHMCSLEDIPMISRKRCYNHLVYHTEI